MSAILFQHGINYVKLYFMKILYYAWKEYTFYDAVDTLRSMGHDIIVDNTPYTAFDEDDHLIGIITSKARSSSADIIFSFNYFPDLSRVASNLGIPYISWCYDSPLLTLESKTLGDPVNKVFLFDHELYMKYKNAGFDTVHYLPLACNVKRLEEITRDCKGRYEHEITFLGNMYSDETDFYAQIRYLPEYLRGYVDASMETAMKLYGIDMISETVSHDICDQIAEYAKFDLGPLYNDCKDNVIRFMIQKHTTVVERLRLMTVISENFKVDHYAKEKSDTIMADYKGYADYMKEMPRIFATSKVNLNITLRSIISGIPLRVIDILGAGGFCLTNYQSEIAQYFENGESIAWYESYEDLFVKLDWYLKHDSEREKIAEKGHNIVANDFTYEKRFKEMFLNL